MLNDSVQTIFKIVLIQLKIVLKKISLLHMFPHFYSVAILLDLYDSVTSMGHADDLCMEKEKQEVHGFHDTEFDNIDKYPDAERRRFVRQVEWNWVYCTIDLGNAYFYVQLWKE